MHAPPSDVFPTPPQPSVHDFRAILAGDDEGCRLLLAAWEPLVKAIAARHVANRSDLDDLVQVGRQAVYQAVWAYKSDAGFPFAHYAKRAIKNNVLREVLRLARQRSGETRLDDNPKVFNLLTGDTNWRMEFNDDFARRFTVLPAAHQEIYKLLYVEGLTQRAAAKRLGVSQPRIAQLHTSLLKIGQIVFAA
jgi:RNA polymerase sigma factor (sigma-70 family)